MALQEQPEQQQQQQGSSGGSPRRRKAPLDIDQALYLQSQASYVQEPNVKPASQSIKQVSFNYSFSQKQHNQRYYASNISVDYIDCLSNTDLAAASSESSQHGPAAMRLNIPGCRKHLRFSSRNRVDPRLGPPNHQTSVETNSSTSPSDQSLVQVAQATGGDSPAVATQTTTNEHPDKKRHTSSVLYPISVSEVKKRTYFIGQDDSLLGEEELHRYFPNGRVNIFVCTWNQNRKRAPMNLNDLLLPDKLVYMPDIYAIGIQEAFSSQQDYLRDWEVELQTTLGPNHVLLHSCSLGTLHLSLFVRRDLIWFCSTPEESVFNSRSMPTNMIKTKGAVCIAFRFFGTSFMFTNCHFPAHENRLKDRIDEYQRIINSIDLPKNLKLLKPRYLSQDPTARFDCCFFMGDLNFRLEQRTFDETITILEDIFQRQQQQNQPQQQSSSFEALTQCDELLKVMESDQAFHGFDESQIKFPPTYKFLAQTNKYDRQTKRVPSYTDRILFRSKRQRHIQCLIYDWLPQLLSSDHKPVYCLFDVLVRPGHEQHNLVNSLNAGLFHRSVYLEALKRRAEDPDGMRENGAGGNLICSIS